MIRTLSSQAVSSARRKVAIALLAVLALLATSAAVHAAAAPGVAVTVAPSSQTIVSGSSASGQTAVYSVVVSPTNGFEGPVTLSASNLPKSTNAVNVTWTVNGVQSANTAQINVPPGSLGVAATLMLSGGQPSTGTFNPTVTATPASGTAATATTSLTVVSQNTAYFGLWMSQPLQTIAQGAKTTATINVSRLNWTGVVSFGTVLGLPGGASASITPTSTTTSGNTATLSISTTSNVAPGLYPLTITGTGATSSKTSLTQSTSLALVIQAATTASASAPASDATNTPIPASSISSALAGANSGATGTVTFKVFGPQASAPTSCTTGGTTVGTATVAGSATYHPSAGYTPSVGGTYWWYASYSGDAYNSPSGSACDGTMASTVVKNTTTATVAAPASGAATGAIAASAIGSALSGATTGATGTVTFKVFGPQASAPTSCTTGGTTVGTATVAGSATYHPSAGYTPSVGGTYWWYATYSGDAYNSPSASACATGMVPTVIQDFSIVSSTASQTALTGGVTDDTDPAYAITVTPISGYAGSVNLSVANGLPSGSTASAAATASFSPNPAATSSTLKIDVGTGVTANTYTLTVQGQANINGTTVTRSTQVTLIVQGSQHFAISGSVPSPLYPGGTAQTFPVTLTNPNSFAIKVTSLGTVGIAPVNAPGCDPSWFQVTLPSVPGNGLSVGAGSSVTLTATAQMLDKNVAQDACQGKQLTLTYTGSYTK